jgi:ribose transport system permease protein
VESTLQPFAWRAALQISLLAIPFMLACNRSQQRIIAVVPKEQAHVFWHSAGPVPVILLLLVGLLMSWLLRYTRLGRHAYAIGGNSQAAHLSGIDLTAHGIASYSVLGGLTGLAGMIEASRLVTGQPTAGEGYELRAIATVVIGGGSLNGGVGTVLGTTIAAFIMSLLNNGCNLLGISPFVQQILIGGIIVPAVAADEYRRRHTP